MVNPEHHSSQAGWVLTEWLVGSSLMLLAMTAALRLIGDLHVGQQVLAHNSTQNANHHMAASLLRQQLQGLEQAGSYTEVLQHASGSPLWVVSVVAQPQWPISDCVGYSGADGQILTSRYWIDRSTLYCLAGSNPVAQPLAQGVDSFRVQLWQLGPQGLQAVVPGQRVTGPMLRRVEWGWNSVTQAHHWIEAIGG